MDKHMFTNIPKPGNISSSVPLPKKPLSWTHLTGKIVLFTLAAIILAYVGFQLIGFTTKVAQNWNELQFAYTKPEMVKALRTQYQSKATALDSQFTSHQPSEEAIVLEQVKQALQTPSK